MKDNEYIRNTERGLQPTSKGWQFLEQAVTDTEGNVYGFYGALSSSTVAAAMARLSRYGGDLRELLLKEFATRKGAEINLLRRVLTQFGDDSVQQLAHVSVVVEQASNLLTKQLEWGRLAAYLEQSTRYIYFDQKQGGRYKYYVPEFLPHSLRSEYVRSMDSIFDNYSVIVHELTDYLARVDPTPASERDAAWRIAIRGRACDAARGVLPVATTSTVGIVGSAQAIDGLIMHLMSQELPEAYVVGQQILQQVRKTHSVFFERTDMPERGEATVEYRRQTKARMVAAAKKLDTLSGATAPSVVLLEYAPRDEMGLLPHMLHPYTNADFSAVQRAISGWASADQQAVFDLYMGERANRRHKPGRALEIATYTFEIVCDYGAFRDLQRHRMVSALDWQTLTPDLGYSVPLLIADAGLEKLYKESYLISQRLYRHLQKSGFALESQYATLLGHRMRWKVTMNAREAFHFIELRTQPAGHDGYRAIARLMHQKIAQVHPRLAAHMIFVDRRDDDPSMNRLEQNKRAQAKLRALGLDGLIEG